MRIITAFRAFFTVLFHREVAEQVLPLLTGEKQLALESEPALAKQEAKPQPVKPEKKSPRQSEAITLLAALQREARFLDFVQENLEGYDDAQIGAAARSVHDQCATAIARFFAVEPLRKEAEMSELKIEESDAALVQLTGDLSSNPPYRGRLTHHGWVATKCELPQWSGKPESALVLAPAELELI